MDKKYLLETKGLSKHFPLDGRDHNGVRRTLKALDNVSFGIASGEVVGIVGESGCGKTTLARTLIQLYDKTAGEIFWDGKHMDSMRHSLPLRRQIQMVFQDPYASLNPRMTVYQLLQEPLLVHHVPKKHHEELMVQGLESVGLNQSHLARYPHEFSGGQRQRIGIVRALILEPRLLICDEAISALDVSIQAQVVNLLKKLQREKQYSILFIAHDLSMVKYISDHIGVMYMGNLVEFGTKENVFAWRKHPYTETLLAAAPSIDLQRLGEARRLRIEGEMPSLLQPPSGCKFRTRCQEAMDICALEEPVFQEILPGHQVACHKYAK